MRRLLLVCFMLLIVIRCDKNNDLEISRMDDFNPIEPPLINIGNPIEEYSSDWGDTSIISIEYHEGKWVGLTQWKNVNVCSVNDGIIAIEFSVKNNQIFKNDLTEPFLYFGNRPEVKIQNDLMYVIHIEPGIKKRRIKSIDLNSQELLKEYTLKQGDCNIFAIDDDNNFYISETPGITITSEDSIKNENSEQFNYTPQGFPIGIYDKNQNTVKNFGRWVVSGKVQAIDNIYEDIFFNQHKILINNDHLYALSFKYGYLQKYTLNGEFKGYLDYYSKLEILQDQGNFNMDMEILKDKLFINTSIAAKEQSAIMPTDENEYICLLIEIDISGKEMYLEKIYYFFPDQNKSYSGSFDMIDEETAVFARIGGLDVFKLH